MDLPELRESEASGEKARVYAEIRRLGGVPMVALIFRHLATLPGAIEWMWAAMESTWRSGALQEAAWRIAREAPLAPIARIPKAALRTLGGDEEEIRVVLRAYNRANPENLLTVLCLLRLLDGHAAGRVTEPATWNPPAAPGPLAPMGDIESLPQDVTELLQWVAAPGEPGTPRIVQSLYRHFTHRPAFLALAVTLVRQRLDDGSIDAGANEIHAAMSRAADEIVAGISAPPAPHPGIEPVCTRFGGRVIPEMIVAGRLLEDALKPESTASAQLFG